MLTSPGFQYGRPRPFTKTIIFISHNATVNNRYFKQNSYQLHNGETIVFVSTMSQLLFSQILAIHKTKGIALPCAENIKTTTLPQNSASWSRVYVRRSLYWRFPGHSPQVLELGSDQHGLTFGSIHALGANQNKQYLPISLNNKYFKSRTSPQCSLSFSCTVLPYQLIVVITGSISGVYWQHRLDSLRF